jgi:hypothetical protein
VYCTGQPEGGQRRTQQRTPAQALIVLLVIMLLASVDRRHRLADVAPQSQSVENFVLQVVPTITIVIIPL